MVLLPAVAAFGLWPLSDLLVSALSRRLRRTDQEGYSNQSSETMVGVLTLVGADLLAGFSNVQFGRITSGEALYLTYGPEGTGIKVRDIWDLRAADICQNSGSSLRAASLCELADASSELNILEFLEECGHSRDKGLTVPGLCESAKPAPDEVASFLAKCEVISIPTGLPDPCRARTQGLLEQLALRNWPVLQVSNQDPQIARSRELATLLPDEPLLRIDMSPQEGRLAQDITAYSGSSQIQAYTQQLSLIHLMWGYQLGIFYSDQHGSPAALNDLSDWMGVEYAFLDSEDEASDKFDKAIWGTIYRDSEVELHHYADAPPLGTASTKPTILVVSDPATDVYSNVFRMANAGLAPYSNYLLVEGSRDIDDFSPEELSRFDVLLLHGYQYGSGEEAWDLLNANVSGKDRCSLILAGNISFLSGNGITWLKIAAVTIIPRPFLREGDNLEWAERIR